MDMLLPTVVAVPLLGLTWSQVGLLETAVQLSEAVLAEIETVWAGGELEPI